MGNKVIVKGTLRHARSGHHHTDVLLDVESDSAWPQIIKECRRAMRIVISTILLFAGFIGGACSSLIPLSGNTDPTPIPARTNGNPSPSPIPASEDPLVIAELERFASMASIRNLKDKNLGERDAELRVWVGFGPAITRGLILTNDDGLYSGVYIHPAGENARSIKPRSVEAQHG